MSFTSRRDAQKTDTDLKNNSEACERNAAFVPHEKL